MVFAALVLVGMSLSFMLVRVVSARGQRATGTPLRTVTLTFYERVLLQRVNLYGVGIIVLLGAIGRWLPLPFEVLTLLAAYGVLMVPVRYRLTTAGVGINSVVFRPWSEFESFEVSRRRIILRGTPGNGGFSFSLLATHHAEVLPLLQRYLTSTAPAAMVQEKGGGRSEHTRRRRLLARRS